MIPIQIHAACNSNDYDQYQLRFHSQSSPNKIKHETYSRHDAQQLGKRLSSHSIYFVLRGKALRMIGDPAGIPLPAFTQSDATQQHVVMPALDQHHIPLHVHHVANSNTSPTNNNNDPPLSPSPSAAAGAVVGHHHHYHHRKRKYDEPSECDGGKFNKLADNRYGSKTNHGLLQHN